MSAPRPVTARKPRRREWSGLWTACPICHRTMDMVEHGGREVYECPDCLERYGEKQLELFG